MLWLGEDSEEDELRVLFGLLDGESDWKSRLVAEMLAVLAGNKPVTDDVGV
jgi:hypothetical protein